MRQLSDDEAWIVSHNLRLVELVLRNRSCDDATRDDLRAAGYLGLCYAICKYDPEIGRWSKYALLWIRMFVRRERQNQSLLTVPDYYRFDYKKGSQAICKANHGAEADRALNAHRVGLDDHEAAEALAVLCPQEMDGSRAEVRRLIEAGLDDLSERQRMVIRRVVMHGEPLTQVATELDFSRQRVASIRDRAIRVLMIRLNEDELRKAAKA